MIWVFVSQVSIKSYVSVGSSYIGQTSHTIANRYKGHECYIKLTYPDKSALADHCISTGRHPAFQSTSVLFKRLNFWDMVITEAVEIHMQNNIFNNIGLQLSPMWQPVLKLIRS